MIKVKFNNEEFFRAVEFSIVSDHVIRLKGAPDNNTGFCTFTMGEMYLGDFSAYNTIYKKDPGVVYFSDDGSEYVEPEIIEPEYPDIPEGDPVIMPSLEERVADLEAAMIELYENMEV